MFKKARELLNEFSTRGIVYVRDFGAAAQSCGACDVTQCQLTLQSLFAALEIYFET